MSDNLIPVNQSLYKLIAQIAVSLSQFIHSQDNIFVLSFEGNVDRADECLVQIPDVEEQCYI